MQVTNDVFLNISFHIGEFKNENQAKKRFHIAYRLPPKLKTFIKEIIVEWYEKNKH